MHTDGGSRGNPGPAGIGVVISKKNGEVLAEIEAYIGERTNNIAEYEALIRGLSRVWEMYGDAVTSLEVCMDSELVVRQCLGRYKVKDAGMKEKFAQVVELRQKIGVPVLFTHVRREQNAHADRLVNHALDTR